MHLSGIQKPGMIPSGGGRGWRGSEVSGFGVPVTFGVTELSCINPWQVAKVSHASHSWVRCNFPGRWALGGGRPETSSRAVPVGCSEAGTNVLVLAVGLGCLAAGKGRGAMEENVQDCHLQCMNKQLWMGLPNWANLPAEMGIALDRHRAVPICTDPAGMEGWTGAAGRMGKHTVGRTG